jgi:hypothetical protein
MAKNSKSKGTEGSKLTKVQLMRQIDEKLTGLNLLKSALLVDASRTQERLLDYQKRLYELVGKK